MSRILLGYGEKTLAEIVDDVSGLLGEFSTTAEDLKDKLVEQQAKTQYKPYAITIIKMLDGLNDEFTKVVGDVYKEWDDDNWSFEGWIKNRHKGDDSDWGEAIEIGHTADENLKSRIKEWKPIKDTSFQFLSADIDFSVVDSVDAAKQTIMEFDQRIHELCENHENYAKIMRVFFLAIF